MNKYIAMITIYMIIILLTCPVVSAYSDSKYEYPYETDPDIYVGTDSWWEGVLLLIGIVIAVWLWRLYEARNWVEHPFTPNYDDISDISENNDCHECEEEGEITEFERIMNSRDEFRRLGGMEVDSDTQIRTRLNRHL
uniref:Uncharacterized protein n=1 Tax=Candidatus Methanogaster sp. ANME-2c ERB4 TaxID=2759911 RepID=A0A7G9YKN9_9EURY|nr:hypothetical protein CJINKJJD_00006 [Methanosarcinales archaeon ANME-2c ERB4]